MHLDRILGILTASMKYSQFAALALAVVTLSGALVCAQEGTSRNAQPQANSVASPAVEHPKVTAYTLPPDLYKKARDRSQIRFRLDLIGFLYGLVVLWIILHWRISSAYRNWAEAHSARRFLQALIYAPLILLTISVLTLPLDIYGETIEKRFGLSVQTWGSWGWDWIKAQIISLIGGTILIWLLYLVIRSSPRRWWFYFWLVALPIGLLLVFIQPWVIDPLFHKFEPLQQKDPALTAALEQMVQRAGENIPPERMFWMGAGEKTTALNAYVTGFGSSKRVVVWDNTIARMSTPQIVFVAGHETGHYVLQHIPKEMTFFALLFFLLFYLGYRCIGWVLERWGAGWGIRGIDDWASLPALMLLLSVFTFAVNPITSAVSRYFEHQADQYGLEVTHGLTPDSGQVAAQAFQILGEVDLADPAPNPVNVLLFYSHPTIPERIHFALTYDPWANSGHGEFVK
jgi:Zn-dependent protease with chaperone function